MTNCKLENTGVINTDYQGEVLFKQEAVDRFGVMLEVMVGDICKTCVLYPSCQPQGIRDITGRFIGLEVKI
jgi:hypothetical protein